jgi:hypothetical protein
MTDDSLPTHLPPELTPGAASCAGCGDVYYDQYYLDMFRRALIQCDRYAREYIQHHFGAVVLDWLRCHPRRALACHLNSEEHYVNQAFEHFWQMSLQHQELEVPSLACALLYLRTSLNSAILDALRSSFRPQESLLLKTASTGDSFADSHSSGQEIWEIVEGKLSDVREQRLAYLLFHCGLKPGEIAHSYPQEFSDVREISLLRLKIMNRLCNSSHIDYK